MTWIPEHGRRDQGRPKRRWRDAFDDFFRDELGMARGERIIIAANRDEWQSLEQAFVEACDNE